MQFSGITKLHQDETVIEIDEYDYSGEVELEERPDVYYG
jgi:hypothetical protein